MRPFSNSTRRNHKQRLTQIALLSRTRCTASPVSLSLSPVIVNAIAAQTGFLQGTISASGANGQPYNVPFFFQAEDGIRDYKVTGVQTCALPIWGESNALEAVVVSGEKVRRELK